MFMGPFMVPLVSSRCFVQMIHLQVFEAVKSMESIRTYGGDFVIVQIPRDESC